MHEFDRLVGRVRRRLGVQLFLALLVWCLGGALILAALVVTVDRLVPGVTIPGPAWAPLAVAGGAGLLVAALAALLLRPGRVEASVAIDHAFHLDERLSSALTLPESQRSTPAGQALIADTLRQIARIDVGSQFGPRLPRRAWVTALAAVLAVAVLFLPDLDERRGRATARGVETVDPKVVRQQAESLKKSIARSREELEAADGLSESARLLAEIEKMAEELAKSPPAEKEKALVQLNTLTDVLKERREQIGAADQINRQLQQLQALSRGGPAEEFAREMARGDFQAAAERLEELQKRLQSGGLSEAETQALAQQLSQMQQQLRELADLQRRREMLEQARQSGGLSQQEYEQQMARLDAQARDLQALQKLAEQLGAARDALQQGDLPQAASALGMSQEQLESLAQQIQELQTLDAAMADLMECKAGLAGDSLNQLGTGLDALNGYGMGDYGMGQGTGLGRGRGRGDRPEAPDDVAYSSTRAPQQYGQGKAVVEGFAPPRGTTPGESLVEIQEELEASGAAEAEALSNQRVPSSVKKHVLGYFDKVRESR